MPKTTFISLIPRRNGAGIQPARAIRPLSRNFHGENMYERPTGIAIDRKAGRLYLADTPRNLVFILDLHGNVLKRLGRDRHGNGSGDFASPTQIAVSDHGIVVLDAEAHAFKFWISTATALVVIGLLSALIQRTAWP